MTWAQVWTVASNAAIRALDPLLSAINWVANNIQTVVPIVISLGTAFWCAADCRQLDEHSGICF